MTHPDAPIVLTKMDAANRQVRAAIRMWFAEEDPVAIHTIVAASHELIHNLFRHRGLSGLLFDSPVLKEEYRSEAMKKLKEPATFFKHAQRDPNGVLEFHPGLNELLLLTCINALTRMGEPACIETAALNWWTWVNHPGLFQPDVAHDKVPPDILKELRDTQRGAFLEACRELWKLGRMVGQPNSAVVEPEPPTSSGALI